MKTLTIVSLLFTLTLSAQNDPQPTVCYIGNTPVTTASDGGLRPVIGTHNIQVVRANRTAPAHRDNLNDTYLHAPMLAYWKGCFQLDYLSALKNEHQPPTTTSYTRSHDGINWEEPRILFPAFELPDSQHTLNHQRMSFYVSPNDKLLATAFYGEAPSPNDGSGIGRTVREINEDGSFGPIYFIRYNQQEAWDAAKTMAFPFYSTSDDSEFVKACKALLQDKKITAQWWEEDRSEDEFYKVTGKAMSYYTLKNGRLIGLWKDAQVGYSDDNGETWTRTGFAKNLEINGSKYWGQRTADGNFALVYNPTTRLRHPLALMTSEDGITFNNMAFVHGELPNQRFPGLYKNMGPQYVRGITEGNGSAPDGSMWLTYSVNKEDIWVSAVPIPIEQSEYASDLWEDFSEAKIGEMPMKWNCYRPLWAPISIADSGGNHAKVLKLEDEDPYDYASATRVFKESRSVVIEFDILTKQRKARIEIDVCSADGQRPVQIAFTEKGEIEARHEGIWKPAGNYEADRWMKITLDINPGEETERYQLLVDGKEVLYRAAYFTDYPKTVERITFRTGHYRRRGVGGHELPDSDLRAPSRTFLIDNIHVRSRAQKPLANS